MGFTGVLKILESSADFLDFIGKVYAYIKGRREEKKEEKGSDKEKVKVEEDKNVKWAWLKRTDEIFYSSLVFSGRLSEEEKGIISRFVSWLSEAHPFGEASFKSHFAIEYVKNAAVAEEKMWALARAGLSLSNDETSDYVIFQAMYKHCETGDYTSGNFEKFISAIGKAGLNSVGSIETFLLRPSSRIDSATGITIIGPSPMESVRTLKARAEVFARNDRTLEEEFMR